MQIISLFCYEKFLLSLFLWFGIKQKGVSNLTHLLFITTSFCLNYKDSGIISRCALNHLAHLAL